MNKAHFMDEETEAPSASEASPELSSGAAGVGS